MSLKGSRSVSDLNDEEEIKVQYVRPIGGNTLPPQYSKEISRYQPSKKERVKAMKDALSAVRQFTSEGNLSRNGNLNTATMKEVWDYESQEPFLGKTRDVSKVAPEKSKNLQAKPKIECELCGGNHKVEQCPHERKFSSGMDTTSSDTKDRFPNSKSKSVDYSKPQWKWPSIWRPAQSVNGITNLARYHCTRDTLIPDNLLELDLRKDQLGMGHKQILPGPKTKAWVDEQNRINTEKTLGYDKTYEEARDTMHPDIDVEPPVKSQKRGTVVASEKEKDTPQPSCALQEFVKHIADPLVDKGWNLHLKFGKGDPQGEQFAQGSSPWEPTAKADKKEKVSRPQISRQIPLEMGTGGGGGGGKKGGSGGKKPPEDEIEIEDHLSENEEDDSSLETSLELNIDPQQLASVRLDRPLLRLRLTPRGRIIATAPGGGGTPPPSGGGTVTVPLHERQNGKDLTNLLRVVEAHHNHHMVGMEELVHRSQKGVEEHLSNWWVEEEMHHLVVVEVVMGMVMIMEEVVCHLPKGEMEEMAVMVVEMIHCRYQIQDSHGTIKVEEIGGCMWYKDHPDPQANQDKMEGMVGMDKHHKCPEE